jgi:hypothetical protein
MEIHQNQRHEERFLLELPVMLEGGVGFSRDISGSGIYFVTDQPLTPGGFVQFSMKLDHVRPGKPVRLDCQGQVLRVEAAGAKLGVAASICGFWCIH